LSFACFTVDIDDFPLAFILLDEKQLWLRSLMSHHRLLIVVSGVADITSLGKGKH